MTLAPSSEQSAKVFGRGRGCDGGCDHDFGGHDSYGGGCGFYDGRLTVGDKGPR